MKKSLLLLLGLGCILSACFAPMDAEYPEDLSIASGTGNDIQPGMLTAGEWNDSENWSFWQELYEHNQDLQLTVRQWDVYAIHRYPVLVLDLEGAPLPLARVELLGEDASVLWQGITDYSGKVDVWAHLNGAQMAEAAVRVTYQDTSVVEPLTDSVSSQITLPVIPMPGAGVQVMFAIDATGSMGDELEYLKVELGNVIDRVQQELGTANIETGAVVYRDEGDDYVTRSYPLSNNHESTIAFLNGQSADGGGDTPEAVEKALENCLNQNWDANAKARLIFLLLDAPPHALPGVIETLHGQVREAARLGIKIIPIAASGIDKETEFLMRMMALATHGTYVFITNHSGIGNEHVEPTVGAYQVEYLNNLMARLIVKYSS